MLDNYRYRDTMKRLKKLGINTNDHESVVQQLAEEIDRYQCKIKDMEQIINGPRIMYVCDRRKCEHCISDGDSCGRTSDIRHAKNFELCGEIFCEVPPIR